MTRMEIPYSKHWKKVLVEHIRTAVDRSERKGVVLGLSGGLDSALAMALAVEALGGDRVVAILMPSSSTPGADMEHARSYAEKLEVNILEEGIDNVIDSFKKTGVGGEGMAEANLQSRIRMVLLYYHANAYSMLVLGTSNKTELMVGYFTKYGDGSSDICPTGDLYKTQVRRMAADAGVPDIILHKTPSAGLPGVQGDEEEIGFSYEELDTILYAMEMGWDNKRISEETGVSLGRVEEVRGMVWRNRHKRGLGNIPKIGISTVGLDLREDRSC